MSDNTLIEHAAQILREARADLSPVARVSETLGLQGLETAYRVAEINTRLRLDAGRRIVGKKVGLTSVAVQQQLGVDQPDFGVLFDDMEFLSGGVIDIGRLIQPKVEAEVAFVIGKDLPSQPPTYSEFLRAVAHALPALEVVDSAIRDWRITLFDTVADNASAGLYVLGNQPVDLGSLQLAQIGMSMSKGGEVVSIGNGAACLGHPLRAAYWLARVMATRGEPLRAGEVILSGALGPMVAVSDGDQIVADIGALGSVSCQFRRSKQ